MIKRAFAAAVVASVSIAASATAQDGWPDSFTVGTASQGGTYFAFGSGWANLVGETLGISGGGEVTGGPTQNLALVHTGELAFGMTTMGPARDALNGESPLAPGVPMDQVRAIFPMYQTPFSITVLGDSDVMAISDIPAGARIGFGPSGSTSDTYFPAMLETLGVEFERVNGSWTDLAGQLQDGLLDVVAFAAGIPIPAVSQLEAQTEIRLVEFNETELQTILDTFPVSAFTIPAATYGSIDEDKQAVSMWNFAIANAGLSEDFVYNVVKTVMENHEKMMEIHKASRTTIPENYVHNTFIPWHPGAVKWFEENGIDIPDDLEG